jgi:hypothetical protein
VKDLSGLDPTFAKALIARLRSLLDISEPETFRRRTRGFGDETTLLDQIADAIEWKSELEKGERHNIQHLLEFAFTAGTILYAAERPGGEFFIERIRALSEAGAGAGYHDLLFEGEVAVYFQQQVGAARVEFEAGPHPDLWVTLGSEQNKLRVPVECKRIQPIDLKSVSEEALATRLEDALVEFERERFPIKVIVWLHGEPKDSTAGEIIQLVRDLMRVVSDPISDVGWKTASTADGLVQVSAASLGEFGEMREREIRIDDVPAKGSHRIRIQTVYLGKSQDPARARLVLSVRNDAIPARVGAFERNLHKAIHQLALSALKGLPGIICIRLRPPRGLGDLYEADRIVRRKLQESSAEHVTLVGLFWNEAERTEGQQIVQEDGSWFREVEVKYSLVPYFIANPSSRLKSTHLDSLSQRFPAPPEIVIRDPETGELTPVSGDWTSPAGTDTLIGPGVGAGQEVIHGRKTKAVHSGV